jgi:hypothetical protein
MSRKILKQVTLDNEYLEKFEKIISKDPRIRGNVSLSLREYIKSVVDENESQKKVEGFNSIFSPEIANSPSKYETLLPYIFDDKEKHVIFNDMNEIELYSFIVKTRETSLHAERVFKNRFDKKIYSKTNELWLVAK